MNESYYEQWEKRRKAERKAFSKARKLGPPEMLTAWHPDAGKAWKAWQKSAERLAAHESSFGDWREGKAEGKR